ncbi:MAG: hypothetical protein H6974_15345 [Gammaproteobacteria bacterium]|nr:hypothetical protein [Gammaproteobacteria bacterium]
MIDKIILSVLFFIVSSTLYSLIPATAQQLNQPVKDNITTTTKQLNSSSEESIAQKQTTNQPASNNIDKSSPPADYSNNATLQQIIEANGETLKYLSISIAAVSIIIGVCGIISVVLQWNANKENRKELETKINDIRSYLRNELISNIEKNTNERLPILIHNAIMQDANNHIQNIINRHEDHLRSVTAEITNDAEQRFYLAQLVRSEMLSKRISEENQEYLDASITADKLLNIIAYHEADALALTQLLSLDNQQVFTGLGTFISLPDPLPNSLLILLKNLQADRRFSDPKCHRIALKLANRLSGEL